MRVTRISLTDLLNGAGANPDQRQALADVLRSNGTVAARLLETRADGASVLELGSVRVTLKLAAAYAPGDVLWISLDDSAKTAAAAPEVKLSRSAQLLQEIQKPVLNQILTEIEATEPMTRPAAAPADMARALQHAVRSSGLFYESHLAGWVSGQVPLEAIREEPQARVADPAAASAAGSEARETVHPRLEHLVRQQLDTLERQSIAWRGFLWPQQEAEMVISGEPQMAGEDAPRAWRVHLDMTLPTLGPLKIDLALNGRRLDVRLQSSDAAVPALREGRGALAHALGAHDLDVNPIRVAAGA